MNLDFPDIDEDIGQLRIAMKEVGMNSEGLCNMARVRCERYLREGDLVAYGSEIQYWWSRVTAFEEGR